MPTNKSLSASRNLMLYFALIGMGHGIRLQSVATRKFYAGDDLGMRVEHTKEKQVHMQLPSQGGCCQESVPEMKRNKSEPVDAAHRIAHLIIRAWHRKEFYDQNGCGHHMPPAVRSAMKEALAMLETDLCGSMTVPIATVRAIYRHFHHRPHNTNTNGTCLPCTSLDELNLPLLDLEDVNKAKNCSDLAPHLLNMHSCLERRLNHPQAASVSSTSVPLPSLKDYAGQGCQLDAALTAKYGNWCGENDPGGKLHSDDILPPSASFNYCQGGNAKLSERYHNDYQVCRDAGTDEACLRHDHGCGSSYWHLMGIPVMLCKVNKDLADALPSQSSFLDNRGTKESSFAETAQIAMYLAPCKYLDPSLNTFKHAELWWWSGDQSVASCGQCSGGYNCYLVPPLPPGPRPK
eukprot:gnl/TRDRNA2_/TRDRNA2_125840_c0_seq4.p1 gnl/TRDRNA2_/TRDRNA2_125840_c0~~gnl/TRDRNA2_/TRDRNA2_125840_c0_seq4.p1  ORF type:complete len:405 (-),score=40.19 gnl/TRDRNA2_/TRDRNA2_125840_c0_seq4:46-1260(-)